MGAGELAGSLALPLPGFGTPSGPQFPHQPTSMGLDFQETEFRSLCGPGGLAERPRGSVSSPEKRDSLGVKSWGSKS